MSDITIKSYHAANGGDYDKYILSNGKVYYLWLKKPFYSDNQAYVHIVGEDDREIGIVILTKDYSRLKISLGDKEMDVPITIKQYLKPNKKYFFDKIVRNLLIQLT